MSAELTEGHIPDAEELALSVPPSDGVLSPERLEERHQLVGLYRELNDDSDIHLARLDRIKKLSEMSPEEARLIIKAERDEYDRTGTKSQLLEDYDAYVRDLRAVRRGQREHMVQQMKEITSEADQAERREKFLDAISFSPVLAQSTLERIDQKTSHNSRYGLHFSDAKLFSQEQIEKASRSPELFQQALVQAVNREPSIVITSQAVLRHVASPKQMHEAIKSLSESHPDAFTSPEYLKIALSTIEKDKQAEFVEDIFHKVSKPVEYKDSFDMMAESGDAKPKVNPSVLAMVISDQVIDVVGQERASELAYKILDSVYYLPAYHAQDLIDKGLLPEEVVKHHVMKLIMEDPSQDFLSTYMDADSKILTENEKAILYLSVIEKVRHKGADGIRELRSNRLLSPEDKDVLVKEIFAKDPVEALKADGAYVVNIVGEEAVAKELQKIRETASLVGVDNYIGLGLVHLFINNEHIDQPSKHKLLLELSSEDPRGFLTLMSRLDSEELNGILSQEDLDSLARDSLVKIVDSEAWISLYDLEKNISFMGSEEQQKELLIKFLQREDDLSTIVMLKAGDHKQLSALLSEEEVNNRLEIAVQRFIDGVDSHFYDGKSLKSVAEMLGREYCLDILSAVSEKSPEKFIRLLGDVGYLYDEDELRNKITELASNPEHIKTLLSSIDGYGGSWTYYAGKELTTEFINKYGYDYPEEILNIGDELAKYLDEGQISSLYRSFMTTNPAIAIEHLDQISKYIDAVNEESIIELALSEHEAMGVGGKYLQETLGRISRTDKESTKQQLLREAAEFYENLNIIRRSGNLELVHNFHERFKPNMEQERRLVDSITILHQLDPDSLSSLVGAESLRDIENTLTIQLAHSLGLDTPTEDQLFNLENSMGSVVNFGVYYQQYSSSAEHREVMMPMLKSLLDGNYADWKYGPDSEEGLEGMKLLGLVPSGIDLSTYRLWRQDTSHEYSEIDRLASETVQRDIVRIMRDNPEVFPSEVFSDLANKSGYLAEVTDSISSLGQRVGEIHAELKILRSQKDKSLVADQLDELEDELASTQKELKDLQLIEDAIGLIHISTEEIASGRIGDLEKGRQIEAVIRRLSKNLSKENGFIIDQLNATYDSYTSQTGTIQSIKVIDTSDPKVTLEIGARPVGSCQNFRGGAVNTALLGYTDPNSKILLATNSRGKPIARSVFRMLSDENGLPILHVETIYSAEASDGVSRALYQHAVTKAASMGLSVVVSSRSQNAAGLMEETDELEGITLERLQTTLSSYSSRAPYVYVDSAGGAQQNGQYGLGSVSRIGINN